MKLVIFFIFPNRRTSCVCNSMNSSRVTYKLSNFASQLILCAYTSSVNDQLPTKFCAGDYNSFTQNHRDFILASNERPSFQLCFDPILIPILHSNTSFHCPLVRHVNDQLSRTDTSFRPRIYFPLSHYRPPTVLGGLLRLRNLRRLDTLHTHWW